MFGLGLTISIIKLFPSAGCRDIIMFKAQMENEDKAEFKELFILGESVSSQRAGESSQA